MKTKLIKSYLLVVICGLVLLAAALLVILQWGNSSSFSLFGKNYGQNTPGGVNTGLIMICCLVAGPLLIVLGKTLLRSAVVIWQERRSARRRPTG